MSTATQPQPYSPTEVPATGDNRSRFMLPTGPGGANTPPTQAVLACYQNLLQDRRAESQRIDRNREIKLQKISQTTDGEYVVTPAGTRRVVTTHESRFGDGKLGKKYTETGGAFLDTLLLDADRFSAARESDIWENGRLLAEQGRFIGRELQQLNEMLALIVLTKHGAIDEKIR